MLADYAADVGKIFLVLLLGGSALLLGRRWRQTGLRLMIVLLAFSLSGFALEQRHSDFVTVKANETVDDTLLATGNIVLVEGVVNGDLLAFGRSVEVRGTVKGDLVSFARSTVVSGTVEGNIYDLSNSLELGGQLGHNIYGLMQSLRVNDRGRVGGGVLTGAGDVILGEVHRSVTVYAGNADVSGSIGRELTMAGDNLTLTNTARIGGNLSARVRELRNVHIADGATIAGTRDIQIRVKTESLRTPQILLLPGCLARFGHAGGMGDPVFVSRLLPGHHSGSGFWLAQPRAWDCGSGRPTCGYVVDRHHAGWPSHLPHVARGVSDCDRAGEDLGWSISGANSGEASRGYERRLAAGTTGGLADHHRRWIHPVSWRAGPFWCGLPGLGSVRLAALSSFTTGGNDLKEP